MFSEENASASSKTVTSAVYTCIYDEIGAHIFTTRKKQTCLSFRIYIQQKIRRQQYSNEDHNVFYGLIRKELYVISAKGKGRPIAALRA